MAWPTDDLTNANTDAGTDLPSNARAEINAAILKIKAILAEITAAATVWHSGNDGAASGLDADLLDGQQGTYYKDATTLNGQLPSYYLDYPNLTNVAVQGGTIVNGSIQKPALATPCIDGANIESNSIGASHILAGAVAQSEIASGAVHQGQLNTSMGEVSGTISGNLTLPGGTYGFYPQTKGSVGFSGSIIIADDPSTTYLTYINIGVNSGTAYAQQRYINSSPPYSIEGIDYDLFLFLLMRNNQILGCYSAFDPPWAHNGPTKTAADFYDKKGAAWQIVKEIPEEIHTLKNSDRSEFIQETRKIKPIYRRVTQSIKNQDMPLIPHPFLSMQPGDQVVLIAPDQSGVYMDLCDAFRSGESVVELIHDDYLRIDNQAVDSTGKPPGVNLNRIKWKNSKVNI